MLKGVIEGFYGRCWTRSERLEMMDWIAAAGMNLFVYGPKDDIKIRARWRECYDTDELARLADLASEAKKRGLTLMASLSPCLDITHSDSIEIDVLKKRLSQFQSIGIDHITLLFDDIPSRLNDVDQTHFDSFADAQVHVVNACQAHITSEGREGKLYFCPTDYCGAFVQHDLKNSPYLNTIGKGLHRDVEIFWTGPDIVSKIIDAPHLQAVADVFRRRPFIWDNFHANDYDVRRVYAGPLGGRDQDILNHVSGWITNPNNEFEANFVAVHTTGQFLTTARYDESSAFHHALNAWQRRFARDDNGPNNVRAVLSIDKLRLLSETFYQPFACGPEIERLLTLLAQMLKGQRPDTTSASWKTGLALAEDITARLQSLFDDMTELRNRELFYAFHQYLWEARHEMRHLLTYLQWLNENPPDGAIFPHQDRVYNFYRKGFTAALNDLVQRNRSGSFRHGG